MAIKKTYFSEDKKKAIDKVYGILRDGRYCGADGYPSIISEDIFGATNIGNTVKKTKTLALAVMKYNACTYNRAASPPQELQEIIAEHEPSETLNRSLLTQIVSRITVDENKVIAIEFRNGKRIAYKEDNNDKE